MKRKKDEVTIRSSAAEYLTYVASVCDQQDSVEIEKSLNIIIEQFEEMKKDLVFLLSENDNLQN